MVLYQKQQKPQSLKSHPKYSLLNPIKWRRSQSTKEAPSTPDKKSEHKGPMPECDTKSSWNCKKKRRNEKVEEYIEAAVKKEVQEKMKQLPSDTGSRLKTLECQALQDK